MKVVREINAEELKRKMDNKEEFVLIEVLLPELYDQWHLPGAMNIPADVMKEIAPGKLKKAGKVILLKGPVLSGGRKFENKPFYRIIYLMLWSLSGFNRGIDLSIIRKKYYGS
jgi:rhodanese-related sulfurtransferase